MKLQIHGKSHNELYFSVLWHSLSNLWISDLFVDGSRLHLLQGTHDTVLLAPVGLNHRVHPVRVKHDVVGCDQQHPTNSTLKEHNMVKWRWHLCMFIGHQIMKCTCGVLVFINSGSDIILPCHQWCICSLSWGTSLWEPPPPRRWTTQLWTGAGLGTREAGRCLVWTGHRSPGGGMSRVANGKEEKMENLLAQYVVQNQQKVLDGWALQTRNHSLLENMWCS